MEIDIADNNGFTAAVNPLPAPPSLCNIDPKQMLANSILSLLHTYASKTESKSLLGQARSSPTYYDPSLLDGYIPISLLLSLNRMKKLTKDLNVIAQIASTSPMLQVHPDGTKIRRTPILEPSADPQQPVSLKSTGCVLARKFTSDIVKHEISLYFSQFGPVAAVEFISPGVAGIKFMDDGGIAKTMVQAQSITGLRFRGDVLHVEWAASSDFDMLEESIKGLSLSSSNKVKSRPGKYPRKMAGPYKYTVNRILHVDLSGLKWALNDGTDDNEDVISEIEKAPAILKRLFEPYAHVVNVSIEQTTSAYVRFQQPVASELLPVIEKSCGIRYPDYDVALPIRRVNGDEERIYWHVCCARENAVGVAVGSNLHSSCGSRKWEFVRGGASSGGPSSKKRRHDDDTSEKAKKKKCKNVGKRKNDDDEMLVGTVVPAVSIVSGARKGKKQNAKQLNKKAKKNRAKVRSTNGGKGESKEMDLADMFSQL
ncbi:hypothetical protein SeMB42_g05948 [Synchytrium endobioticum]|uniref:HTH La-type RNA-binding domain-containing protein n=1 Tax=Synchytrium endobioticum TaxID=286115 RepID=A0A507CN54_9FUNG|nr:hypothetical protein SeMB42_g05948 [Synchytrium endobioticum]